MSANVYLISYFSACLTYYCYSFYKNYLKPLYVILKPNSILSGVLIFKDYKITVENILGTRNSMLKSMASEIPVLSQKKRPMSMNFTNTDTQTKKRKKANTMPVREKRGWGNRDGRDTKIKREKGNQGEKRKNSTPALNKDISSNKNSLSSTRGNCLLFKTLKSTH